MKDKAYAKINIALDIKSRREDGYHELDSLMVPIDLYDDLSIEKSQKDEFICNVKIKYNETNTIYKAIEYLRNKYQIEDKFRITLNKRIPSQAGLGGGSSDGASAIRIINNMYELNMTDEDIKQACLKVGADVLFTYYNKPARVTGIGENLEFININKYRNVLIVKPKQGVSTKTAYKELNLEVCDHPDINLIKRRLENGVEYVNQLGNSLEEPALKLCPVIQEIKNELVKLGISNPIMSGSGSTVFAISDNYHLLQKCKEILKKKYRFVIVTKMLNK